MGLHFSWQDSLAGESRRYRQAIRDSKAVRAAKLSLVPAAKVNVPAVVPAQYISDHGVIIPPRKPLELALFGIAALGVHAAVAWVLTHLPPGQLLVPPKAEPVEIVFAAPPPPPPPPKVEPPKQKTVEKLVKSSVPVVQHDVPTAIANSDNVVAVEKGVPPAPVAPVVEKVTAPSADASYLNNPPPQYPPVALRQGWQGTVHLRVLVQPDGHPSTITLEKSSGKKVLDDAALAAVQGWRFVPAKRGSDPIEGWVSFPIEFNVES